MKKLIIIMDGSMVSIEEVVSDDAVLTMDNDSVIFYQGYDWRIWDKKHVLHAAIKTI